MISKSRAGGSWVAPWSTIDHVQSQLIHARALLTKEMRIGDGNLLTSDERELLASIQEAIEAVERIKG